MNDQPDVPEPLANSNSSSLSSSTASPSPVGPQPIAGNDFGSMMAKLCPESEDLEPIASDSNTWSISSWNALPDRVVGPYFQVGDYKWRILLFPRGNRIESVSLYLECVPAGGAADGDSAERDAPPAGVASAEPPAAVPQSNQPSELAEQPEPSEPDWAACAQFGFCIWNPDDPSKTHSSSAQHRFNADESDWGFTKFVDLNLPQHRAILSPSNSVNITAYVKIVKDPTGVLWHNFVKYNSKKETGYVGLKNQGATCYLNSLIQSLYFTKVFRNAVYQIPTSQDKPESVQLSLQRLFYLLQTSEQPLGTSLLTRAFGWDSGDAFTQHDVQELNRVLMDHLEGKMKGTAVEGALNKIFVGQMKSYIKCVNVDFESSRIEDFWDIQLNVKGMKDVLESFNDYIQVEMLDGENQYQAGDYGLQDAKKGVVFESFPPVLHLQLKRYEYDFMTDMMVKINDRYEFPLEMDLTPYLDADADKSEPCEYALHGVLVHSGDLNAGHYYALLKPEANGQWYKFDDDRVTRATMKEVLEENFGGDMTPAEIARLNSAAFPGFQRQRVGHKRFSSAYMLVYIRKSRYNEILPAKDDPIPAHIPLRIEQELAEEAARRKEREESHFYRDIRVISNDTFTKFTDLDLAVWDTKYRSEPVNEGASPAKLKIKRTTTTRELYELIATEFHVPVDELQLFTIITRQNKTYRVERLIPKSDALDIEYVKQNAAPKEDYVKLWAQLSKSTPVLGSAADASVAPEVEHSSLDNTEAPTSIEENGHMDVVQATQEDLGETAADDSPGDLIFLKYFDHATASLRGVGTVFVKTSDKVSVIIPYILSTMKWPEGTRIILREEVKAGMIESINPKKTFDACEIATGDIICFELEEPSDAVHGFNTADSYYDFLANKILLHLRKKSVQEAILAGETATADTDCQIWVSKKSTYDQLVALIGAQLGVDPTHLKLYTVRSDGYPKASIKRSAMTVQTILSSNSYSYHGNSSSQLLYDVLDMSLDEFETKRSLQIIWLTDGVSQEHRHEVLASKSDTIVDALEVFKEKAEITDDVFSNTQAWIACNHRVYKSSVPEISLVDSVPTNGVVYLTAKNENNTVDDPETQRLISVLSYHKDPRSVHGVPFLFVIREGELFSDTKVRLQHALGMFDKAFEKVKFTINNENDQITLNIQQDDICLYNSMAAGDVLGLDRPEKARPSYHQAAIFIKDR